MGLMCAASESTPPLARPEFGYRSTILNEFPETREGTCLWRNSTHLVATAWDGNKKAFSVEEPCLHTIASAKASMLLWTKNLPCAI
jgi:hypothetical protein